MRAGAHRGLHAHVDAPGVADVHALDAARSRGGGDARGRRALAARLLAVALERGLRALLRALAGRVGVLVVVVIRQRQRGRVQRVQPLGRRRRGIENEPALDGHGSALDLRRPPRPAQALVWGPRLKQRLLRLCCAATLRRARQTRVSSHEQHRRLGAPVCCTAAHQHCTHRRARHQGSGCAAHRACWWLLWRFCTLHSQALGGIDLHTRRGRVAHLPARRASRRGRGHAIGQVCGFRVGCVRVASAAPRQHAGDAPAQQRRTAQVI